MREEGEGNGEVRRPEQGRGRGKCKAKQHVAGSASARGRARSGERRRDAENAWVIAVVMLGINVAMLRRLGPLRAFILPGAAAAAASIVQLRTRPERRDAALHHCGNACPEVGDDITARVASDQCALFPREQERAARTFFVSLYRGAVWLFCNRCVDTTNRVVVSSGLTHKGRAVAPFAN